MLPSDRATTSTDSTEFERARFEIDLKEVELVIAQSHVRMTIVAQYTFISVTLAGAIASYLATFVGAKQDIPSFAYLIIPLPFFMFAFLTLREDLLMVNHHFYFLTLRLRLTRRLGLQDSDPALQFLSYMKAAKIGSFASAATWFSALRYGVPVFVALPSLAYYVWLGGYSLEPWAPWRALFFLLNVWLGLLLGAGIRQLGRLHEKNEKLVPKSGESAA